MQENSIIKGFKAEIDFKKLGYNFITVTFVRIRYSPESKEKVAEKIMKIKGILSVYYLLGDIDFVLITASSDKTKYENIWDSLSSIVEIERTDSHTVLRTYRMQDLSMLKW